LEDWRWLGDGWGFDNVLAEGSLTSRVPCFGGQMESVEALDGVVWTYLLDKKLVRR
jgi:hypothetical protein